MPMPGQTGVDVIGTGSQPSVTARVLDDGTVQQTAATYNEAGQVTSRTDPVGRQTTYTYAANGVDLLEVRQVNGGTSDLLATYANYTAGAPAADGDRCGGADDDLHLQRGGAGADGDEREVRRRRPTPTTPTGGCESVTAPVAGATTSYTYDGYGRVRTVTGPDGYAVTTDYDVFDRPTRVTYPDGTYEETTYDRLDVATRRDRLGRDHAVLLRCRCGRVTGTRDPGGPADPAAVGRGRPGDSWSTRRGRRRPGNGTCRGG